MFNSIFSIQKLLFGFILCLWGGKQSIAQVEYDSTYVDYVDENFQVDRILISAGLSRIYPQNALNENLDPRFGFSAAVSMRLPTRVPLFAGVDFGTYTFDRYSENYFLTDDDGFQFEVQEVSSSKLFNLHTVFRAQPYFRFFIHPYAEVFLGGKHFYARTRVTDLDPPDGADEELSNEGQFGDWALSYGASLGLNIPLSSNHEGGVEFDLKIMYLGGTNSNYAVELEEINFNNYTDTFDAFELQSSSTNLLATQLGLIIYFGW